MNYSICDSSIFFSFVRNYLARVLYRRQIAAIQAIMVNDIYLNYYKFVYLSGAKEPFQCDHNEVQKFIAKKNSHSCNTKKSWVLVTLLGSDFYDKRWSSSQATSVHLVFTCTPPPPPGRNSPTC